MKTFVFRSDGIGWGVVSLPPREVLGLGFWVRCVEYTSRPANTGMHITHEEAGVKERPTNTCYVPEPEYIKYMKQKITKEKRHDHDVHRLKNNSNTKSIRLMCFCSPSWV